MSAAPLASARTGRWLAIGALLLLLALAGWLRWQTIRNTSLYVDEFTTLWAARQVQAHGAPILPSGVLYTRGLLASYLQAGVGLLLGDSYTAGRLPSLLFGLATIGVVWWVGRRLWRPWVGWLAALGLALLPEAIVWSARARFYAQVQLLALLTVWAAWAVVADAQAADAAGRRPGWRAPLLFAGAFVLALFSQEQALLLYPPLLAALLIWRGRRFFTAPLLTAQAICLAALGARYAIEIWGQPGYFETIQANRPYVGLALDWLGAWRTYAPQLVEPARLPWTLGGLLALGAAATAWVRARRITAVERFHQATLFFAAPLLFVLVVLLLFVGSTWRDPRYLVLVQPLWLLLGAAGIVWLVERFPARARTPLLGAAALALALLMLPAAINVPAQQVEGYDRVLATVRSLRLPGDAVLSPQPPACALVLDSCDGYAIEKGYEEYVIRRDGALVDRWTGSPLVADAAALEQVIRSHPRTWFVSDAFRLATRYSPATLALLIEQFDLVAQERGVLALRADGRRTPPALDEAHTPAPPLRLGPLALTGWAHNTDFGPETPLTVRLEWVGAEPIGAQYNTSLRLVIAAGEIVAQQDGPPAKGIIPTTLFFDTPLPDTKVLTLPVDLPNARYRLDVAAYDVATGQPAGDPQPLEWFAYFTTQAPLTPPLGGWQNGLALLDAQGFPDRLGQADGLEAGAPLTVTLTWSLDAPTPQPLTAFVHLIGADGRPVAQDDHPPEGGFYPTTGWRPGEPVTDTFRLTLPADLPPGRYRLITGWYDATGARVPVTTGGDAIELAAWEVGS